MKPHVSAAASHYSLAIITSGCQRESDPRSSWHFLLFGGSGRIIGGRGGEEPGEAQVDLPSFACLQ